jgi:Sulfatase
MSNRTDVGCYPAAKTNSSCLSGYVPITANETALCCDNRDGPLKQRTPLDFGFETVFATSQVAPSATSNCGCVESEIPGAGEGCELGHYAGAGHFPSWLPALECMQTYFTAQDGTWGPFMEVTDVDDSKQLVDRLESFVVSAVQSQQPFMALVWFHSTHIPYVSPPAFRAPYANYSENEQDYFGAAAAMDAQIGRVRRLLQDQGVAHDTVLVFSADNGPEVSPASGQGTTTFSNPGVTGGLSGRKRAMLEGGIRVTGVIEAPFLVEQANGGRGGPLRLERFAQSHVDLLPTVLELLNVTRRNNTWPLDGVSLVPALTAADPATLERPNALGWMCAWPLTADDAGADCPPNEQLPPSFPANFSLPAGQLQAAFMEGAMKLVGCATLPARTWNWRLFDVAADPAEATDLFAAQTPLTDAMFVRFSEWLASVVTSREVESQCASQHDEVGAPPATK